MDITEIIDKIKAGFQKLNRGPLSWILKVGLSALALVIVYHSVDFARLFEDMRHANIWILIMSFSFLLLSKVVSVDRIKRYYKAYQINISLLDNYKLYFVGLFYNLILPSGFGGDGYKVAWLKKNNHSANIKNALTATFVDRLNGIQGLFILLAGLLMFAPDMNGLKTGFLIVAILGIFSAGFLQWRWFGSTRKIQAPTLLHSILVHGLNVGSLVLNAWALSSLDIVDFAIGFSLSSLAFLFPFFIGGVGSRELALIYLATYINLDVELALFAVFVNHAHRIILALIGLPLMLRQRSLL